MARLLKPKEKPPPAANTLPVSAKENSRESLGAAGWRVDGRALWREGGEGWGLPHQSRPRPGMLSRFQFVLPVGLFLTRKLFFLHLLTGVLWENESEGNRQARRASARGLVGMEQNGTHRKCDSDLVAEPERLGPHNMLFLFRHQTVHGLENKDGRRARWKLCLSGTGGSPPAQRESSRHGFGLLM